MAARKAEPLVKPLRIDAGVMRQQFDQFASPRACFHNRPLHHLLADATTAAVAGDANILDQAARGALRAQPRQDAELQTADHRPALAFRHHQREIGIGAQILYGGANLYGFTEADFKKADAAAAQ